MRIMDRYLLREHASPVFYCLITFSMVFVIVDVFDNLSKIMAARPPALMILRYYAYSLSQATAYIVPASLFLATLFTMWQMTRNNELTAMRACGVSLSRIMLPFMSIAMLLTIATGAIDEMVKPWAVAWTEEFRANRFRTEERESFRQVAFYNPAGRRLWLVDRINILHPDVIEDVELTFEREDRTRTQTLTAPRAEWLDGQWWFFGAQTQAYDEDENPVGGRVPAVRDETSVTEMAELGERPEDLANEVRRWDFLSVREMLRYLEYHPDLSAETRGEKMFDIHSRVAGPWAALIVTLFAIPAGAKHGRQGILKGVVIAVFFFFGFYASTQVGIFVGKRQIVEPWLGAWFANILFFISGLVMVHRLKH